MLQAIEKKRNIAAAAGRDAGRLETDKLSEQPFLWCKTLLERRRTARPVLRMLFPIYSARHIVPVVAKPSTDAYLPQRGRAPANKKAQEVAVSGPESRACRRRQMRAGPCLVEERSASERCLPGRPVVVRPFTIRKLRVCGFQDLPPRLPAALVLRANRRGFPPS
jgi:hypothetical protein